MADVILTPCHYAPWRVRQLTRMVLTITTVTPQKRCPTVKICCSHGEAGIGPPPYCFRWVKNRSWGTISDQLKNRPSRRDSIPTCLWQEGVEFREFPIALMSQLSPFPLRTPVSPNSSSQCTPTAHIFHTPCSVNHSLTLRESTFGLSWRPRCERFTLTMPWGKQ